MSGTREAQDAWVRRVLGAKGSGARGRDSVSQRREALESRYLDALKADPSQRSALTAAWELAGEQTQSGKEDEAAATLERLSGTVDAVLKRPLQSEAGRFGIEPGLVAERRKQIEALIQKRVSEAETHSVAEIGKLEPALEEVIQEPEVLLSAIDAEMGKLLNQVAADLTAAAKTDGRDGLTKRVAEWRANLANDPRLEAYSELSAAFGLGDGLGAELDSMFSDVLALAAEAAQ
jgi:hypothetical protein